MLNILKYVNKSLEIFLTSGRWKKAEIKERHYLKVSKLTKLKEEDQTLFILRDLKPIIQ